MPPLPTIQHHLSLIASGERTARQAVEDCLARCDALEEQLHAWVRLDREGARAQADRLDTARRRGESTGPLFGVPIGVKDLFDVAGLPTGCGSKRLESGPAALNDAPLVARLRGAGAVILGKTVTTHFACFDPPPTRNPWNLDRTPGGSSSGSAVAVATGMCLAALGSQTGGSITRPAAFCGVAGYKPSFKRLPIEGVYPLAPSLDHPGPIARTVADLQLLYDVLSFDGRRVADPPPPPSRLPGSVGFLRGMFEAGAVPDCWRVFQQTLDRLSQAGVEVRECRLPSLFDTVISAHRTLMVAELAARHQRRLTDHPEDYLPGMRGLVEEGSRILAIDYVKAREHQAALRLAMRDSLDEFELLACPSARGGAPTCETTGDPSFNAPWSYTGFPTVTLCMGLDQAGMPLGLQLVGKPEADAELLAQGAGCERLLPPAPPAGPWLE